MSQAKKLVVPKHASRGGRESTAVVKVSTSNGVSVGGQQLSQCYNCQQLTTHLCRDCPDPKQQKCMRCQQPGHMRKTVLAKGERGEKR